MSDENLKEEKFEVKIQTGILRRKKMMEIFGVIPIRVICVNSWCDAILSGLLIKCICWQIIRFPTFRNYVSIQNGIRTLV